MESQDNYCDILYFVPEDNERLNPENQGDDTQTHYNVFTIPDKTTQEVTLKDVQQWFPLPGDYHFRFQFVYQKNIVCWLDINNFGCKLPQVDGMIVMKVLRKSWITSSGQSKVSNQQQNVAQQPSVQKESNPQQQ
tara:strand:+ start:82 stop:486 length:405 start_codon:yes stop_codon:yes gene_type:complete